MQWNKTAVSYMKQDLHQLQTQEQTLELRLPEGMPEIGNVLCTWGQPVIRSKEWRSDSLILSGGVHGWVLYAQEEDGAPQSAECWLPFQMKWNLPESRREGVMRMQCSIKNMDARTLSARKLLVRVTVSVLAEAMEMTEAEIYSPPQMPEDLQLLKKTYPMQLAKEAGEKLFLLDEDVEPSHMPEKIIACCVEPYTDEENVVGDKAVLRGNARLHLVYMATDGKVYGDYIEIPFSQFAELEGVYDKEASMNVVMAVSSVEPELADGRIHMKCAVIAQYVIFDLEEICVVEDAYSPCRSVDVLTEPLCIGCRLDQQKEKMTLRKALEDPLLSVADVSFYPQWPMQYPEGNSTMLETSGCFQVLGYDTEGKLCSKTETAQQQMEYPIGEGCGLHMQLWQVEKPENSGQEVQATLQLCIDSCCNQQIPMIVGLEMAEEPMPSEDRPSLILRRMEGEELWDLAKSCGSTVGAIRKANGLSNDPVPGQMLLIPVC